MLVYRVHDTTGEDAGTLLHPVPNLWGEYWILDPNGRLVQTEYDLMDALEAARYMNEHLHQRAA